jgi:hypothetical protein
VTARLPRAAALAAALLAIAPAAALDLPGSTWGDVYWELPRPGEDDLVLEGWARQGIAWWRGPAGPLRLQLQTYATVRYKWDSLGLEWNNYLGPGLGAALDLGLPSLGVATVGVEYVHQWSTRSGVSAPYWAPFLDWYGSWDVAEGHWPGASWGDLRWELPESGPDDLVLEGWVRQGRELHRWRRAPYAWVLSAYARVRFKLDSRGLDWNNYAGPGAGLAVDLDGLPGLQPALGLEYAWEKNLASAGATQRIDLVLRWYAWWDLRRR